MGVSWPMSSSVSSRTSVNHTDKHARINVTIFIFTHLGKGSKKTSNVFTSSCQARSLSLVDLNVFVFATFAPLHPRCRHSLPVVVLVPLLAGTLSLSGDVSSVDLLPPSHRLFPLLTRYGGPCSQRKLCACLAPIRPSIFLTSRCVTYLFRALAVVELPLGLPCLPLQPLAVAYCAGSADASQVIPCTSAEGRWSIAECRHARVPRISSASVRDKEAPLLTHFLELHVLSELDLMSPLTSSGPPLVGRATI